MNEQDQPQAGGMVVGDQEMIRITNMHKWYGQFHVMSR